MYSYNQLVTQNLPIYVRVKPGENVITSWPKQLALLALITAACLTGFTALTYYTHQYGLQALKPFGLTIDPLLMIFDVLLFVICIACMALWLQEENLDEPEVEPDSDPDKLSYIFPKGHSLHVKDKAYDLESADNISLVYPHRVRVQFKNPDLNLLIYDDKAGYPTGHLNPLVQQKCYHNNALFVYLTGTDLPNRFTFKSCWWWNIVGGLLFVQAIILPFLFQVLQLKLYWVGFLAIPVAYMAFRVGQKEFRQRRIFDYQDFFDQHRLLLDEGLFRNPDTAAPAPSNTAN